MIVRIDANKLADAAGLLNALGDAFGFTAKNRDALVDVLTHLDHPKSAMSRVQVFPGEIVLIAIEGVAETSKAVPQAKQLADVVAFVNWRRLERGEEPVLALAYES